jgi:hypothetical protein
LEVEKPKTENPTPIKKPEVVSVAKPKAADNKKKIKDSEKREKPKNKT